MEEVKRYDLDASAFDTFAATVQEWLDKLALGDWEVDCRFEALGNMLAQCSVNREARRATITLSKTWYNEEPTRRCICEAAQHEVLELLLDDIWFVFIDEIDASDRKRAEMERANHAIIHRLQKVLI